MWRFAYRFPFQIRYSLKHSFSKLPPETFLQRNLRCERNKCEMNKWVRCSLNAEFDSLSSDNNSSHLRIHSHPSSTLPINSFSGEVKRLSPETGTHGKCAWKKFYWEWCDGISFAWLLMPVALYGLVVREDIKICERCWRDVSFCS